MSGRLDGPFPLKACRDLLGLCRSIRAAWVESNDGDVVRLEKINGVIASLVTALELASTTEPGTLGHRAAWQRGSDACIVLGNIVSEMESVEPLVTAARKRVSG